MLIVNFIIIYANNMKNIQICNTCKWFIPNINDDYGKCKMFGENLFLDKKEILNKNEEKYNLIIHNYAKHCRENENQCGEKGYFYEKNNLLDIDIQSKIEYLKLNNQELYQYTKFIKNNKKDYFSS